MSNVPQGTFRARPGDARARKAATAKQHVKDGWFLGWLGNPRNRQERRKTVRLMRDLTK